MNTPLSQFTAFPGLIAFVFCCLLKNSTFIRDRDSFTISFRRSWSRTLWESFKVFMASTSPLTSVFSWSAQALGDGRDSARTLCIHLLIVEM